MKIAVIGASGRVGGTIVREALSRGHEVTAIARDAARLRSLEGSTVASADVSQAESIGAAVAGHDGVLVAISGRQPGEFETVPSAARVLLNILPRVGVRRLLFSGGGGSLEAAPGLRFVDAPEFPPQYREEALAQAAALSILRAAGGAVDWSYASPPPVHLDDGERTGVYRVQAGDRPIVDERGESRITLADFASALVDELERPAFIRQRFTAAY